MKTYKSNLIIQGMFVMALIGILIGSIFERGFLGYILIMQFFLGITQYISAWVLKYYTPDDKLINIYLLGSSLNILMIFIVLPTIESGETFAIAAFTTILFIIPWMLALFYWYISFKNVKYLFFKKSVFQ